MEGLLTVAEDLALIDACLLRERRVADAMNGSSGRAKEVEEIRDKLYRFARMAGVDMPLAHDKLRIRCAILLNVVEDTELEDEDEGRKAVVSEWILDFVQECRSALRLPEVPKPQESQEQAEK